jgi:transposase
VGSSWLPAPRRHVRNAQDCARVRHRHARTTTAVPLPVRCRLQRHHVPGIPKEVVRRSRRRKTFLIIDNGPCHSLDEDGKLWLASHRHRIELFRLPPYSPEFNPIEGVWKVTKKRTTHNRFYKTTDERDAALCATFATFQAKPTLIANHVARFL